MAASTRKPQPKGTAKPKAKGATKAKAKPRAKGAAKGKAKPKAASSTKSKPKAAPKAEGARKASTKGRSGARSAHRYAITHDIERPHMRLGFIWFIALVFALVLGPVALGVLFALVSAVGAMQVAKAWGRRRQRSNLLVAGLCGAALPLAAGWGGRTLGLAVLGCVAASLVAAARMPGRNRPPLLATAGLTVRSWLFVGGASASVILCAHYDLGAAVALVVLMSAYDAGDYVVGSGAGSVWEGPLGGIATVGVLTFSLFVMNLSPFEGGGVVLYGAVLAVLAPLGQLAASAVLPTADDLASGLRRVDSVLLAGPVWAVLLVAGVGQ
jgi:hypothetical protein